MSWCDLQAEEQLASLFTREFFQSGMKQVFNKCKLMVKTKVAMMLYLLLLAATAALKLWAAGIKIRVALQALWM